MDVTQSVQIDKRYDELVREYVANKEQADALTARNAELTNKFAVLAKYKDGCNTGHLVAGGYKLTVTKKVNTRWLSDKLENARSTLTDELFFNLFAWRYEPRSKKELDAFLKYASSDFRTVILSAMETSPGKPSVKLEAVQ